MRKPASELYERIVEAAPSAIVMVDADGNVALINVQAERLFGWDRGELLGKPVEKLVPARFRSSHPDHRAAYLQQPVPRAMGAGRDLFALRRDGSEVPVEIGLSAFEAEGGPFVLATLVDLSERRQAEARFRAAVESSPNAIAMVDDNGVIVLTNAELERLFGYDRDELFGQPIEMLVPGRFRTRHPEYRAAFARDPRPRAMGAGRDLYGLRRDGSDVPVEIGLAPIEADGRLHVLASIVDITERRRAEDRFRRAVDSAPNAMIMVDARGQIVLANSRTEEMFKYEPGALLGQPIDILIPSRFRAGLQPRREAFYQEGKARAMGLGRDLFALRSDGVEFPVEIGLNPIETDEEMLVLASVVDITARKRSEEARELAMMQLERSNRELVEAKRMLEHANAELERGNRELDEFAYAVSHDLRSPLRAIQNLAGWIREDAGHALGEEPRGWLDEIPDRIARMDRLLEDLLGYSRAIRAPSALEETEFGELVSNVVRILDIPSGFDVRVFGRDLRIYTPRAPLQRVLCNLIQNAVHHHDEKSGTVTVTARHANPGMIEVEVADDGPGIPPHLRERAFGLFRSLSNKGGSGLGLALVRRVVENQGGKIDVRSNDPRGAVFYFTWPIRAEP